MSAAIDWQGDWAQNCDFPQGNDIKGVATSGDKCSGVCESTSGCTHFVFINGMCYLKSGDIGKKNAFYKAGAVCGVVNGNSGNHGQGNLLRKISDFEKIYFLINSNKFKVESLKVKAKFYGKMSSTEVVLHGANGIL